MRLFRRKPQIDIRVLQIGDVVLINGSVFRVDPGSFTQLPVIPVSKAKQESEN